MRLTLEWALPPWTPRFPQLESSMPVAMINCGVPKLVKDLKNEFSSQGTFSNCTFQYIVWTDSAFYTAALNGQRTPPTAPPQRPETNDDCLLPLSHIPLRVVQTYDSSDCFRKYPVALVPP